MHLDGNVMVPERGIGGGNCCTEWGKSSVERVSHDPIQPSGAVGLLLGGLNPPIHSLAESIKVKKIEP